MAGIARACMDSAGGLINIGSNTSVRVNGIPAAVYGCSVSGHGDGAHSGPNMRGASSTVRVGGIGVCRIGDSASCGHGAGGSGNVVAGG
jgi:uncharacterized Zn-binding protein involved in type VI secretion